MCYRPAVSMRVRSQVTSNKHEKAVPVAESEKNKQQPWALGSLETVPYIHNHDIRLAHAV